MLTQSILFSGVIPSLKAPVKVDPEKGISEKADFERAIELTGKTMRELCYRATSRQNNFPSPCFRSLKMRNLKRKSLTFYYVITVKL